MARSDVPGPPADGPDPADGPPPPARPTPDPAAAEDPLAADRRTLAIGAGAVAAFVAIGVVSAQLFVTGGCISLDEAQASTASAVEPDQALDADAIAQLTSAFDTTFTRAVQVPGAATGLVPTTDGLAVTGEVTTTLDADLEPLLELETPGVTVGDGPTLFHLALANELTGQVDGFTPVPTADLDAGSCTDTAVVSEQFAFLLDAREGQLLQLRVDEDGDDPAVELRDGGGLQVEVPLELPSGPAGVLGERVTAGTAADRIVIARRVTADDPGSVVVVADALDGEPLIEVDRATLLDEVVSLDGVSDDQAPLAVEVLAVGSSRAWLAVREDPVEAMAETVDEPATTLVELDLDDGELTARSVGPGRAVGGVLGPDEGVAAAQGRDGPQGVVATGLGVITVTDLDSAEVGSLDGVLHQLRWDGDRAVVTAEGGYGVVSPPDEASLVDDTTLDVRDVRELDGQVLVLVRTGGGSVVLAGEAG